MAISEEMRAYNRKWNQDHQQELREYREATKERRNNRRREMYSQNEQMRKDAVKAAREYREQHPLQRRATEYGISARRLELMLNDGCAICGANPLVDSTVRLHVDHDHTSGRVRGILCNSCNLAIGHLRHDPIIVSTALKYLLKDVITNG